MDLIQENQVSFKIHRLNNMRPIQATTPYVSYPFTPPNYTTFKLDTDILATSRHTIDSISNLSQHPWISNDKFEFDCFNIKTQKTGDLMGAMTHIQSQQSNPFDITIKIPGIKDYTPFANFLAQNSKPELSFLDSFRQSSPYESNLNFDLNNLTENKSLVISEDHHPSIFTDLDFIRNGQLPQFSQMKLWEEKEDQQPLNKSSLVYSQYILQQTDRENLVQNYFFEANVEKVTQQEIIIQIIQALQGIEGRLFILDYQIMKWSVRPQVNFMISYYYKQSTVKYIEDVLLIADIRSKLDVALQFIRIKQFKRQLYSKIVDVITNSLQLLEALLTTHIQYPITFLQFCMSLAPIKIQLNLFLSLLIKQDYIDVSFCNFGKAFLHNENEIFKFLFTKLELNDYCEEEQKQIIKKLTISSFHAILFSLNVFLHYNRQEWENSNNRQFYFGLLFEERKEYIDKMIQKLNMINSDDLEIYNVCKEQHDIEIVLNYSDIVKYEYNWRTLFKNKMKTLKGIGRRIEKQRQIRLEQIIENKAIEIAEMKVKLMQRVEATSKLKAEQKQKQRILIRELQKQINQKIESRKLLKLIQIEKEKGYLLDSQLKEKDILLNKKYQLLANNPDLIGKKMQVQDQNISIHSSEPRSMLSIDHPISHNNQPEVVRELIIPRQHRPPIPHYQHFSSPSPSPAYRKAQSTKQFGLVRKASIRSLNRTSQFKIEFQQDFQRKSDISQAQIVNNFELLDDIDMQVPIKTSLEICVFRVIKNQVDILNEAYRTILYHKYRLDWIFQFIHTYILTSNGDPATNLLNLSMDMHSFINISYLKDYFFDEGINQEVLNFKPMFYRSDNSPMIGSINLIQFASEKSLQIDLGFKFNNLPEILKPIFNYIHMAKYMQIFAFVLRMRHCVQLLQTEWKKLQTYQKIMDKRKEKIDRGFLKKLFDVRYKIQCFFNLFQNYFFIYVVQKQYKVITQTLRKQQIQNLPQIHLKFLQEIFKRGFIQPQKQIASRFKKTFILVKQFDNIVNRFCSDDIASYDRPDTDERLRRISRQFMELHGILQSAIS